MQILRTSVKYGIGLLLCAACSRQPIEGGIVDDVPSSRDGTYDDAGVVDRPPTADVQPDALRSLVWERAWGPCPPNATCTQRFTVGGTGELTFDDRGTARHAVATQQDLSQFVRVVTDEATIAALRGTSPCGPPTSDQWESVEVVLGDGGAPIRRDVAGCTVMPFGSLREERTRGQVISPATRGQRPQRPAQHGRP
jgi:hypothetical protein